MFAIARHRLAVSVTLVATTLILVGCESYFFLPQLGGTTVAGGGIVAGDSFTADIIQERTFLSGTAVTTVTHAISDKQRTPLVVDFNGDGKVDPVVGYGDKQAVIQILLSRPDASEVNPISLTLDSKRDMEDLADVAVGDIDNDGNLDIVAGAKQAVWYYHHPSSGETTTLRDWGNPDPNDALRERIDTSAEMIDDTDLLAIIAQAIGPGVNLDDYIITTEQIYSNVEIADFDNDGDNDIAASRSFIITMTPRPDAAVEPLEIVDGDVMIFVNPGFATDGHNWTIVSVGKHERQQRLDRDGASGLVVTDMDGDGWLDVVSSARNDNNAQIEWFRNPGLPLATEHTWTPYRVGSIRDSWAIDVADVTGDGRPDVVATGGKQMQAILFEHPAVDFPDDRYEYDWDTHVISNFESFEPRDIHALDIDNDGQLELVVSGTEGAIRYFEQPASLADTWPAAIVVTIDGGGEVGFVGYGDLDGDGDLDLVATVKATEETQNRTIWVRNDLAR